MSNSTHSVASHLAVSTSTYDVEIRRFVPGYDAMLGEAIDALTRHFHGRARPHVIDVGSGTGRFAQAAMAKLGDARFTLLDADGAMLEAAKGRLAGDLDRATFVHGSFFDPLPTCDAAVASLSLHHVHDPEKKRAVYANLRASLAPGGLLVTADAMVPKDATLHARTMRKWAEHMIANGETEESAHARFAQWAIEDRYFGVDEELAFMRAAGFERLDVSWRSGPVAVVLALS